MQAMLDMGPTLRDARRGSSPVPIIAFVRKAYSAGAFVALNCDWIFMASDAQMGSAQAVQLSPGGGMTPAPEKILSPVRSAWRSAARMNPRREPNTALWLAMVDPDIVVYELRWTENGRPVTTYATELDMENNKEEWEQKPGYTVVGKLVEEGKLLTVGANQAKQYGLVDRVVVDRQEMVSTMVPSDTTADVTVFQTSWGERLSRFMSGPIPTTILLLVAILALGAELFGASGIGATVFAFCIGLYFYCQFIAGSAGGLEILLFVAGIGLLGVEVFVVPGFGIAGFGGLGLMLLSLFMSAIPDGYWDIQFEYGGAGDGMGVVGDAALQVVIAIASAILVLMVVSRYLEYVPLLGGLVLSGHVSSDVPEKPQAPVVGKEGVAITDLRPSGKAEIDGKVENVVAEGGYVEEGERVKVIASRLGRMVVEKLIVENDEA
jgi:membrane-bound serine protease (ClpP class)